jgi:precorrin-6A/cobalt-precorrin-6A reductase
VLNDRILILAGTSDARLLANALAARGYDVTSSFAGVTAAPLLPMGQIHRGGFGGAEGFANFLSGGTFTRVVDATHSFAAQMSAHAHAACAALALPLSRLERPAWQPQPGDHWISVSNLAEAATYLAPGARVLLTTGHKGLDGFFVRADLTGLVRVIEEPSIAIPAGWILLRDRPPHSLENELDLFRREAVTALVSKNAGGDTTSAKLAAARQLGLPVIMVERPPKPPCPSFPDVAAALLGITGQAG